MNRFDDYFFFVALIGFASLSFVYAGTDEFILRETVRRDRNTKFVIFGSRHGNRNPETLLMEAQELYGFEGPMELTAFGKRQSYALGRELRSFLQGFLSGNYISSEAVFYTSSASRTQMTLQAALAGLFPPRSFAVWNLALDWTPVPYKIDDPMLRMYSVACPESDTVWKPIDDEQLGIMEQDKKENEQLLNYISAHTGWRPTLESAAILADNLDQFELHNFSLPEWLDVTNFTLSVNETLADEIMNFQEYPQIQCGNYKPCRNLMSGVWLQNLADTLEKIANNTDGEDYVPSKVAGYVSHTEIVLSIMLALGLEIKRVETGGGFMIEVRDVPAWEARLIAHEPLAIDEHIIFKATYSEDLRKLATSGDWIPIGDLIAHIRTTAIPNWPVACGIETEDTSNVPTDTDKLIVDVLEVARTDKEKASMTYSTSSCPISVSLCLVPVIIFQIMTKLCI